MLDDTVSNILRSGIPEHPNTMISHKSIRMCHVFNEVANLHECVTWNYGSGTDTEGFICSKNRPNRLWDPFKFWEICGCVYFVFPGNASGIPLAFVPWTSLQGLPSETRSMGWRPSSRRFLAPGPPPATET